MRAARTHSPRSMQHAASSARSPFATKLFRYRWLTYELITRDLKLRYRGSALGFAWTLLNPLLFMGVYVLVFGVYLRIGIPNYALYLLSGLLPWAWFSNALLQGTSAILDGRMYVGKTIFPAEVLVLVPVCSNFVNFLFSLPVLVVVVFLFHGKLGAPLLALPAIVAVQTILTVAVLFFVATLNVFYRDFQQLMTYAVMLLFYLTPIFYQLSAVPPTIRAFVEASPITVLVHSYQQIFYSNEWPDLASFAYLLFAALVLLGLGHAFFKRHKETFGEYL